MFTTESPFNSPSRIIWRSVWMQMHSQEVSDEVSPFLKLVLFWSIKDNSVLQASVLTDFIAVFLPWRLCFFFLSEHLLLKISHLYICRPLMVQKVAPKKQICIFYIPQKAYVRNRKHVAFTKKTNKHSSTIVSLLHDTKQLAIKIEFQ